LQPLDSLSVVGTVWDIFPVQLIAVMHFADELTFPYARPMPKAPLLWLNEFFALPPIH
jgi:hypothetical protein